MPFDTLLRIGMSDDYPSSHYVFETQGHQISIADERLGEALSQIESAGRNLLLLAYFLDLNDREIGALLGISSRRPPAGTLPPSIQCWRISRGT